MVLTAFLFIVVAHTCYYAALRDIKAVVCTSVMQLTPVVTCVLSALVYGDRLTWLQFAGGAATIGGATLAALAQANVEEAV
jgi:drug/metabolite transporter (DMT)-like permease